ncbi:MAG: EAL domain-containing protein [Pseudomonadales bacterium]
MNQLSNMFVISPHAAVCEIVNLTTLAAEKVTALKGYKKARLQNKELEKSGIDCVVSVNVSGLQISDTKIVAIIKDALQNSGLAPNKLIIEITESLVMEDLERGLQVLEAIRDIGVSVSIDDFGTGYSSLSYLKKSPISELKIDQSFLRGFPANDEDTAIVRAIIALAHSLDLYVTAEGVETQEQVNGLKNISCELLQGYYFSKPLAFDDFKAYYLDYQVAH